MLMHLWLMNHRIKLQWGSSLIMVLVIVPWLIFPHDLPKWIHMIIGLINPGYSQLLAVALCRARPFSGNSMVCFRKPSRARYPRQFTPEDRFDFLLWRVLHCRCLSLLDDTIIAYVQSKSLEFPLRINHRHGSDKIALGTTTLSSDHWKRCWCAANHPVYYHGTTIKNTAMSHE